MEYIEFNWISETQEKRTFCVGMGLTHIVFI